MRCHGKNLTFLKNPSSYWTRQRGAVGASSSVPEHLALDPNNQITTHGPYARTFLKIFTFHNEVKANTLEGERFTERASILSRLISNSSFKDKKAT